MGGLRFGASPLSISRMMKTILLIDGGHLRARANLAKQRYTPDLIEAFAQNCIGGDERLLRVLYYDCPPYVGSAKLPVSQTTHQFAGNDSWIKNLAGRSLFAVRLGTLKFRGFKPKKGLPSNRPATDSDFTPDFEQKGVDMRIGIDIAAYSHKRIVDRIVLVTADTDCIPAMKHARKCGLQVVLCTVSGCRIAHELRMHSDLVRDIQWPNP